MVIDGQGFAQMLLSGAEALEAAATRLGEIDSRIGDGDHGVTTTKIARCIICDVSAWDGVSMHDLVEDIGDDIMDISGGSAGPLYATMIGGLAGPLAGVGQIDSEMLKAMFASSLDAMREITDADVGDKTMMDALIPAVAAASAADDIPEVLAGAAAAAKAGAQATTQMVSRFGRARSYGEQTIGTQDAGATSTALFLEGLAKPVVGMDGDPGSGDGAA